MVVVVVVVVVVDDTVVDFFGVYVVSKVVVSSEVFSCISVNIRENSSCYTQSCPGSHVMTDQILIKMLIVVRKVRTISSNCKCI